MAHPDAIREGSPVRRNSNSREAPVKPRLGVIGGGQLALNLCEAARGLGVRVSVISQSDTDVALMDQFLADCDVITLDKEAVPRATLVRLIDAQARGRVRVSPGADTLLMLRDRVLQKTWLQQQGLPTLPYHILSGREPSLDSLGGRFGKAVVQKARCGGDDGRDVQIIHALESGQQLWDVPSIIEPCLTDSREISVVTVRDLWGNIQTYPPVSMESDPRLNSLQRVTMPAALDPSLEARAVALAERVAILLSAVGVFAIEMFVTPEGELSLNEISPGVHNSGHLALDACNVSPFEQHVRAICGLPLVAIECEAPAAMLNLLYYQEMRVHRPGKPVAISDGAARRADDTLVKLKSRNKRAA